MATKVYQCGKCRQVTTFHKVGYPCAYCGHPDMEEYQPLINKADNPFNKSPTNKGEVEYQALCREVELNRKEIMIAFRRLVDIENKVEAIENKLRD